MTEYYSGQGIISLTSHDNKTIQLGNCSSFQIYGSEKLKLVLEDFNLENLAFCFSSPIDTVNLDGRQYRCVKLDNRGFNQPWKIKFTGINSTNNKKVMFSAMGSFTSYQSIKLISNQFADIILHGEYVLETAIFGYEAVEEKSANFKENLISNSFKNKKDLVKVNDSLIMINSANTVINVNKITTIELADAFHCKVTLDNDKTFTINEPLKQVTRFLEKFRYNYLKDVQTAVSSMAEDVKFLAESSDI